MDVDGLIKRFDEGSMYLTSADAHDIADALRELQSARDAALELEQRALMNMHDVMAERDALKDALRDMLSGWRYIRQTHGDLYGVGWDRAQQKAEAALEQKP